MLTDMTLRVEPNGEMPKLKVPMMTESPLSGRRYVLVPKKFTDIRWHPDGAVIIEMQADKRLASPSVSPTRATE